MRRGARRSAARYLWDSAPGRRRVATRFAGPEKHGAQMRALALLRFSKQARRQLGVQHLWPHHRDGGLPFRRRLARPLHRCAEARGRAEGGRAGGQPSGWGGGGGGGGPGPAERVGCKLGRRQGSPGHSLLARRRAADKASRHVRASTNMLTTAAPHPPSPTPQHTRTHTHMTR